MQAVFWKTAIAVAAIAVSAGTVSADETNLIMVTQNPATADLNTRFMHPWAERINEQAKGLIHIDVRDGNALANPTNFYDQIVNDAVQITWGGANGAAGKFPLSEVLSLPLISENAEVSSVAYYRLYESGLLNSEFNEVIPLFVFAYTQNRLHFVKPVPSLDNLAGLRMIAITKGNSDVVENLDGTPQSFKSNEVYEVLQRGVADGVLIPWPAFQPFHLAEVTSYHVDAPLGSAPGIFIMSRKKYESLPEAARRVIDANSGEAEARQWGALMDDIEASERDKTKALGAGKQTVIDLPAKQLALWRQKLAPLADAWAAKTPGGARVLAKYRELLAQVKAGQ